MTRELASLKSTPSLWHMPLLSRECWAKMYVYLSCPSQRDTGGKSMALTTCILQASNYDGHQDDMPRINKLRKLTKKELDDCELLLSAMML